MICFKADVNLTKVKGNILSVAYSVQRLMVYLELHLSSLLCFKPLALGQSPTLMPLESR